MTRPRWKALWLFLPLGTLLLLLGISLLQGLFQSLGYIPALGLYQLDLSAYREIFQNPQLLQSLGLSLYIAGLSSLIATALAVFLAFALVQLKLEKSWLYALIRLPIFVPWMVTALMMMHLLSAEGWLARLFSALGLHGLARTMEGALHGPSQFGVIFALVWAMTPFACFLLQSLMSQISEKLDEAAANLGARLWQRFWNLTLPLCWPAIRNAFLILFVSALGNYEIPLLLGMTLPRALPVEAYVHYAKFDLEHRPRAMALNALLLFLSLSASAILLYYSERGRKHED